MKKYTLSFLFSLLLLFFLAKDTLAIVNPLDTTNNKFGIHILDEKDLNDAQNLVNSSGGDWGYVTLVIREDERDIKRWQDVFNTMRRLHIIPIIRIASKQEGNGWKALSTDDIEDWVYFLNSLNWVVKNRYIIIGNEVNHAYEWGGEVKPGDYANVLCNFYSNLKLASEDFFVIHAGLDASSPNNKIYKDEETFIKEGLSSTPSYFSCFDGWASHSYPNPNFSGSEQASGKGSIKTYKWEEELLKSVGLKKEIPIFITETGWAHNMGDKKVKYQKPENLSTKIKYAFENVWTDRNIVAVTPFVLNYNTSPFNVFSWKTQDGSFYPFYNEVKNIQKVKGTPQIFKRGDIKYAYVPKLSKSGNTVSASIFVQNDGQSIWDLDNTSIDVTYDDGQNSKSAITKELEPGNTEIISIRITIPGNVEKLRGKISISQNGEKISGDYDFEIYVIRPISEKETVFSYLKNIINAWVTRKPESESQDNI